MTFFGFLILMLIAAVAGALGQAIAGYSLGGCLVSIVVGFIGALLGGWIGGALGLPEIFVVQVAGFPFPMVWSIIGAALFTLLIGVASRGRR